jgi:eukaryotic-like serine/threonine-protein kinase
VIRDQGSGVSDSGTMQVGQKLGAYEVVAKLGEGGMGEVYRARDGRLGRDVALKILPRPIADATSLARFEQEARHVAALNHPNIVAVFDIGTHDGVAYMVSELVDGATLRGASLPLRKVTEIGAQIADALAAAHAAGVTHRDIKPDNVMVTRSGRVKVLDFGVATVGAVPGRDAPTVIQTQSRSAVGTVGYMAPEQVRGEAADPRTDIFAVGALLYELLAGVPAFRGETAAEIMTAALKSDPPELPADVPLSIKQIVSRCLEKNPEERFQSARDLAFALRQHHASTMTAEAVPAERRRVASRYVLLIGGGFAAGMLLTGALAMRWAASRDAAVDPIQLTRLTFDRRSEQSPALSPDGRSISYVRVSAGLNEILVQPVDSPNAVMVARSNVAVGGPVWSADGNQVCYTAVQRELLCVGAAGGAPRRLLEDAALPRMSPDGRMVYFVRVFQNQPWLFGRGVAGGEPQRIGEASLPTDVSFLSPVSADGSSLVATGTSTRLLISLRDGARRELPFDDGVRTRGVAWLPDSRHVVLAEETTALIGTRLLIQDTRSSARRVVLHTADHIEAVTASADGTRLVYSGGPVERDLVEYSSDGRFVRAVADSSILEGFPAWAPTGDRFVYRAGGPGQSDGLWLGSLAGGSSTLVQRLPSNDTSLTPISPDGERVAYVDPTGIQVVALSGGRAVRAYASTRVSDGLCWSADGEWIWFSNGPARLGRVPSGGGEAVVTAQAKPGALLDCSPDGHWLIRRGSEGFVLTSTDGTSERILTPTTAYAARAANTVQFGERGTRVYLLRVDRRTIDVLDVDSGRTLRAITFEIPVEDLIDGFAFSPDGSRVLLSIGGDRSDLWIAEGFARPAISWMRWLTHWQSAAPRVDRTR